MKLRSQRARCIAPIDWLQAGAPNFTRGDVECRGGDSGGVGDVVDEPHEASATADRMQIARRRRRFAHASTSDDRSLAGALEQHQS